LANTSTAIEAISSTMAAWLARTTPCSMRSSVEGVLGALRALGVGGTCGTGVGG
jgi:hypothetical protein